MFVKSLPNNPTKAASTLVAALFLATSVTMIPTIGFAKGGGETENRTVKKKLKCKKGFVLNKRKKKCVKAKKSSNLDQESIFEYGRNLAYAGRFEEAIDTLHLAPISKDHRVLNMLGYSFRKSGHVNKAMGYYYASIAVNPNYSLVRHYLGEAYVNSGNLDRARVQLTEIERICGSRECAEYSELADLITNSQS